MIESFDYDKASYPTSKVADVFPFELSENLGHTWIVDLDGTILEVNAPPYTDDKLLPGVKEMWAQIPKDDFIIIMTARPKDIQEQTLKFIQDNDLHYHLAVFGVHHGERIVVNDNKPGGLQTAIAWNVKRNKGYDKVGI